MGVLRFEGIPSRRNSIVLVCYGSHNRIPQTGWFNNRRLLSHSSGGWKSKIKVLAELASPEASLLCSQVAAYALHPHMVNAHLYDLILHQLPL